MTIDITEYEKKYTFELEPVTQLCGQNIAKKTYILESLRRYFSSYKYREEQNKWRDNVKVDNEVVGRKYFTLLSVNGITDILLMIKLSKQSLLTEYMMQMMQKMNFQMHLQMINNQLEEMFRMMNEDMNHLGDIEFAYATSDVWEMVQKTSVTGSDEGLLEDKGNYELILIFLNLLEEVMKTSPKKMLVILENIDHLISRKEYMDILSRLQDIGINYDVHFILSTSMEGYVGCDKALCHGIAILNDVDFQMPEFDEMVKYIHDNYPYNKSFSEEQMQADLAKIIHRIGQKEFLCSIEENVVCKLINQSMMVYEKWRETENVAEIAFLKA